MMAVKMFLIFLTLIPICLGAPIRNHDTSPSADISFVMSSHFTVLLSVGFLMLCGLAIFGCTCWQNKTGQMTGVENCAGQLQEANVSTLQNNSEFAIFPPCSSVINLQPVNRSTLYDGNEKVIFEPLPDILPKRDVNGQNLAQSSKPAHFSALLKKKSSLHDWFDDPNSNFPRNQLQYLEEIGSGWFGRVVQGEAQMSLPGNDKTPVIVKILREEASPSEHLYFLHEVKPYRDLHHPNIVRLLGRCLETDPFLLIMEHTNMSLKEHLLKNQEEMLKQCAAGNRQLLKIACDVSSGVLYMHEHNFVHTDIAAHNCFVSQDDVIKIGDYGTSYDVFKEDYYCLEDIALPIRWYSPESLRCSETTIETQEVTKEANVWSLGILFWEVLELGKLPYPDLSNEEVLQKVIVEKELFPKEPENVYPYKQQMYKLMLLCWEPLTSRPRIQDIHRLLQQLMEQSHSSSLSSFEHRWKALESKGQSSSLKFENDFVQNSKLHNTSAVSSSDCISESSAPDASGCDSVRENSYSCRSPSLRALNGSYDEIGLSDFEPVSDPVNSCISQSIIGSSQSITMSDTSKEIFYDRTEIDVTPEQICAALRDLDAMLASESSILGVESRPATLERPKARKESQKTISRRDDFSIFVKDPLDIWKADSDDSTECSGIPIKSPKTLDLVKVQDCAFVNVNKTDRVNGHLCLTGALSAPIVLQEEDDEISDDCHPSAHSESSMNISEDKDLHSSANDESGSALTVDNKSYQDNSPLPEMLKGSGLTETLLVKEENFISSKGTFSVPDIFITDASVQNCQEEVGHADDSAFSVDAASLKRYKFVLKEESKDYVDSCLDSDFKVPNQDHNSGPVTSTPKHTSTSSHNQRDSVDAPETEFKESGSICSVDAESYSTNYKTAIIDDISEITSSSKSDSKTILLDGDSRKFVSAVGSSSGLSGSNHSREQFFSAVADNDSKPRSKSISSVSEDSFVTFNCSLTDSSCASPEKDQTMRPENNFLYASNKQLSNSLQTSHPAFPDNELEEAGVRESSIDYQSCLTEPSTECYDSALDVSGLKSKIDSEFPTMNVSKEGDQSTLSDSMSNSFVFKNTCMWSDNGGSENDLDKNRCSSEMANHSLSDTMSTSFIYQKFDQARGMENSALFKKSSSLNISSDNHDAFGGHCDHLMFQGSDTSNSGASNDQFGMKELKLLDLEADSKMEVADPDDYDSQIDEEEVLQVDIETNEAILVDTSESLIGFVPSRSIEMLQDCECLATQLESDQSFEDGVHSSSVSPSPSSSNVHNYVDQNPGNYLKLDYNVRSSETNKFSDDNSNAESSSSPRSEGYSGSDEAAGFCDSERVISKSNPDTTDNSPMYNGNYKLSNDIMYASGNMKNLPYRNVDSVNNNAVDHLYIADVTSDTNLKRVYNDTKPVIWHSNETLNLLDDGNLRRSVILEGTEVLAGYTDTMADLDNGFSPPPPPPMEFGSSDFLDRLAVSASPSPMGSAASTPCRDTVYTPDFESESAESSSSCSSTSGSFECIHNKFKDVSNISAAAEKKEDTPDPLNDQDECSPLKVFSKTWDCHATPNKGLLKSPEKKAEPMKKSVSFHEDPQCVFQYPPASDSSEEDENIPSVDYRNFADWDLQMNEEDEIPEMIEIEELESEPYNRSLGYYRDISNRPYPYSSSSLYTLIGFSEEDLDSSLPEMSELCPIPEFDGQQGLFSPGGQSDLIDAEGLNKDADQADVTSCQQEKDLVCNRDVGVLDTITEASVISTDEGTEEIISEDASISDDDGCKPDLKDEIMLVQSSENHADLITEFPEDLPVDLSTEAIHPQYIDDGVILNHSDVNMLSVVEQHSVNDVSVDDAITVSIKDDADMPEVLDNPLAPDSDHKVAPTDSSLEKSDLGIVKQHSDNDVSVDDAIIVSIKDDADMPEVLDNPLAPDSDHKVAPTDSSLEKPDLGVVEQHSDNDVSVDDALTVSIKDDADMPEGFLNNPPAPDSDHKVEPTDSFLEKADVPDLAYNVDSTMATHESETVDQTKGTSLKMNDLVEHDTMHESHMIPSSPCKDAEILISTNDKVEKCPEAESNIAEFKKKSQNFLGDLQESSGLDLMQDNVDLLDLGLDSKMSEFPAVGATVYSHERVDVDLLQSLDNLPSESQKDFRSSEGLSVESSVIKCDGFARNHSNRVEELHHDDDSTRKTLEIRKENSKMESLPDIVPQKTDDDSLLNKIDSPVAKNHACFENGTCPNGLEMDTSPNRVMIEEVGNDENYIGVLDIDTKHKLEVDNEHDSHHVTANGKDACFSVIPVSSEKPFEMFSSADDNYVGKKDPSASFSAASAGGEHTYSTDGSFRNSDKFFFEVSHTSWSSPAEDVIVDTDMKTNDNCSKNIIPIPDLIHQFTGTSPKRVNSDDIKSNSQRSTINQLNNGENISEKHVTVTTSEQDVVSDDGLRNLSEKRQKPTLSHNELDTKP